ncbi:hypothetical protein CM49_03005 [Paenibacillus sp. P1XP2]|nr:hypothetical protein CM49_03005 [Paenibacillus sp. P1XP2]
MLDGKYSEDAYERHNRYNNKDLPFYCRLVRPVQVASNLIRVPHLADRLRGSFFFRHSFLKQNLHSVSYMGRKLLADIRMQFLGANVFAYLVQKGGNNRMFFKLTHLCSLPYDPVHRGPELYPLLRFFF